MKIFIFAIIALLSLASCKQNSPIAEAHRWERTTVAEADSLTLELCEAYDRSAPMREKKALADSLWTVAQRSSDPRVSARASYWRGRLMWVTGKPEEARSCIITAMNRLDSARYRHDYYMLRSQFERMSPEVRTRYRLATENLAYFRSVGDSLSVAHCLTTLGNLYQ